ncbi:unnamed protein product [Peniophora sp. CBMAI 1063]|nr:unnamed protein product [Peniophora sp. CBMAI 1063]
MPTNESLLNKDQLAVVVAVIDDEFIPLIRQQDPVFSGFAAISKWVAVRKNDIVDGHPDFNTEDANLKKAYRKAVDRKFRNVYNTLRVRESPLGVALLKHLIPRPTALQLYEMEVKKELEETGMDGYGTRLKKKWSSLTKEERGVNRKLLHNNLKTALDVLCRDNSLGGMTALTFLGYRELVTGKVQVAICDGRVADDSPKFGDTAEERNVLSTLYDAFEEYSHKHLPSPPSLAKPTAQSPQNPTSQTVVIPSNDDGVPTFPDIKTKRISPETLNEIVLQYYHALWIYSRNPHHPHDLPWKELVDDASKFYNVDHFDYLCFDRDALQEPGVLYPLAAKLRSQCGIESKDLFTFRPTLERDTITSEDHPPPSSDTLHSEQFDQREQRTEVEDAAAAEACLSRSFSLDTPMIPELEASSACPSEPTQDTHTPQISGRTTPAGSNSAQSLSQSQDDHSPQPQRAERTTRTSTRKIELDARSVSFQGTTREPASGSDASNATLSLRPLLVPGKTDTFASKGYQFKIPKKLQNTWYVSLAEYQDLHGTIIHDDAFNDKKELPALTILAYDPQWMANREGWEKFVISRP